MIFLTVGTQKFPFDRLIKIVDKLIEDEVISSEDVFGQIGTSKYIPKKFNFRDFLTREEMDYYLLNSSVIISHAGAGTMINALKQSKKVIVFPRSRDFGEHIDNHQSEIANLFADLGYCLFSENYQTLKENIKCIEGIKMKPFKSNTKYFITEIEKIIEK